MPTTQGFKCIVCKDYHKKQAFVSHAAKDEEIVCMLKNACCRARVAPYIYELSPEYDLNAPPAKVLAPKVAESAMLFVLLGEEVSKKFWTQAWLGFEVGIFAGQGNSACNLEYVIALQDIRQGLGVCIPTLDVFFLFDFTSNFGWEQFKGLVVALAHYPDEKDFPKQVNRFRQSTIGANVKCGNPSCKNEYVAWIAKRDVQLLGKGFNPLVDALEMIAECTVKCPSCGKTITRCFRQQLLS